MIPFITSRTSTRRLLPPRLAGGIKGSTCAHSSSVRSLGYRNLLRSQRPRFFAVHIGGAPLESGHHFESQAIQRIQNVFGRTLRSEVETLTINWNNTKHHLNTFYYCLEDIHFNIIEIRTWASGAKLVEEDKDLIKSKMQSIEDDISILSFRFNALMAVAIRKVEEIRLRERPRPFLCHQTGLVCN